MITAEFIYFDNNATTRPLPEVVDAMRMCMETCYANPAAATAAFTGADRPRAQAAGAMAQLLKAEPGCITFTSGATETNNWIFHVIGQQPPGRVLLSAIEHPSIREPAEALAKRGFDVREVPVDGNGTVDLELLERLISKNTVLVSILAAHNETGAVQPIRDASSLIKRKSEALFHTDATQFVGKLPIDLQSRWPDVDLLSFSAHKFHGPKGIGGIYVRPGIELSALILGGGQEAGRRSGTSNTPALAGLSVAAAAATKQMEEQSIQKLRDQLEAELWRELPEIVIHATASERLPNTSLFSLPGIHGEDLVDQLALVGIITSTGSACTSGSVGPPTSLLAMGVEYELASAAIRISLSRFNSVPEIRSLVEALKNLVPKHALRPL